MKKITPFLLIFLYGIFPLSFAKTNQGHEAKTFPVQEKNSLLGKLTITAALFGKTKPVILHAYDAETICGSNKFSAMKGSPVVALIFQDILNDYSAKYFHSMSLATEYAQKYGLCATNDGTEFKREAFSLKYVATQHEKGKLFSHNNLFMMRSKFITAAIADMDNSAYTMKGLYSVMNCSCYEVDLFFPDYLGLVVGKGKNRVEARRNARNNCPVPDPTSTDPFTGPDRPNVVCEHSYSR